MKIKSIVINSKKYVYRTLNVEDFLNISKENDFNIFETKRPLSMYEKIIKEMYEKEETKYPDSFYRNIIINILKVCIIDSEINIFENSEELKNIQLFLFNNIIISSLKVFKIPPEINVHTALVIDSISKRYGKLPIDIVYEKKDYNKLDCYFFNKEICSIAIQNEIDNMSKKNKKNV